MAAIDTLFKGYFMWLCWYVGYVGLKLVQKCDFGLRVRVSIIIPLGCLKFKPISGTGRLMVLQVYRTP